MAKRKRPTVKQVLELKKKVEGLKKEKKILEDGVKYYKRLESKANRQTEDAEKKNRKLENSIGVMDTEIANRDHTITEATFEIGKLKGELGVKNTDIAQKDGFIESLVSDRQELALQLSELKKVHTEAVDKIEDLKEKIDSLKDDLLGCNISGAENSGKVAGLETAFRIMFERSKQKE